MQEYETHRLLELVRCGDESAAANLFHRYVDRLIELARSRLSSKLSRRTDPEDVVQSACRSFFRRVRTGEFRLGPGEHLWHLLAAITINKARKAVRRHTAKKRTVNSEESAGREDPIERITPQALDRKPSPDEATILIEETERMMSRLSPLQRQILQSRLQGYTVDETARQAQCSERTVRRAMELARSDLETRLCGAV